MDPSTPHPTASRKSISPLAARYPAGGITNSLGSGMIDDSMAMSTMIPGYPRSRNRSSNQAMKCSSIEAVLPDQGNEARITEGGVLHARRRALDQGEHLGPFGAQGDQESTVRSELLEQRQRDCGPAGRHQHRIVGRIRAPPERAVPHEHRDVPDSGLA